MTNAQRGVLSELQDSVKVFCGVVLESEKSGGDVVMSVYRDDDKVMEFLVNPSGEGIMIYPDPNPEGRKKFLEGVELASRMVANWPRWKQDLYGLNTEERDV